MTKRCATKNQKSIECFKESIVKQIFMKLDFDAFNLTPGKHRVALNFIIDKNKDIINIKASHPNNKLCEEIIRSANEIKIIEPAINKGIKVDYLAEIILIISDDN